MGFMAGDYSPFQNSFLEIEHCMNSHLLLKFVYDKVLRLKGIFARLEPGCLRCGNLSFVDN